MHVTIPLLLLIGAAAAPQAPAAANDVAPSPIGLELGDDDVPRGSAEDQALCRELRSAIALGIGHLARISKASYRMEYGRFFAALDKRAMGGDAGAKILRADLEAAANRAVEAMPRKALIHPCRGTLLELEHRMPFLDDPRAAKDISAIRANARSCVDRIGKLVSEVIPAVEALEQELDRVDAHLKRVGPPPPDGGEAQPVAQSGAAARR